MTRRPRFATLLILLLSTAPLASAAENEFSSVRTTVLDLDREFQADQSSLRAAFEMPASGAYLDRQQQLAEEWSGRLTKFDFASLDSREKVEFLLLRSEVQGLLDDLAQAKKRLAEIAPSCRFAQLSTDWKRAAGTGTSWTARRRPARSSTCQPPSRGSASKWPSQGASRLPRRLPCVRRARCMTCRNS